MTWYDGFHPNLIAAIKAQSAAEYALEQRDREIKEAFEDKVPVTRIAYTLNLSRRGVYDILRRQGYHFSTGSGANKNGKLREDDTAYLPSREGTNT